MNEEISIHAAMIDGDLITNDFVKIRRAIMAGKHVELLTTEHIEFMVACGLRGIWKQLADAKPIIKTNKEFLDTYNGRTLSKNVSQSEGGNTFTYYSERDE